MTVKSIALIFTAFCSLLCSSTSIAQPTLYFKLSPNCNDTVYIDVFNLDTTFQHYNRNTSLQEIKLTSTQSSALYQCVTAFPKMIKIYSKQNRDVVYFSIEEPTASDTISIFNISAINPLAHQGAIETIEYLRVRGDRKRLKVKRKSSSPVEIDSQSVYTFEYNGADTTLQLLPTFWPNQINTGCGYKHSRWYNLRRRILGREPKNYTSISYSYQGGVYCWTNEKMFH